jgi:carbon monoxide dehydrogenase subunit G
VVTYRSKVTAWEPERHLSIQLTGGTFAEDMAMDVRYDLVPEAEGTTLDYDVVVPMKGFAFKVLTPLLWLVASTNSIKDLARLSVVAETA